jgi:hypothetical protein
MIKATLPVVALGALSLLGGLGCASTPTAPFNQMAQSQVTAFRLQNFEPPAAAAATTPTLPGGMALPFPVPTEIQNWMGAGASGLGLGQLFPPGLIPGLGGATAASPVAANAPRFEGFRIISQTQIMDEDSRKELASILGDSSNFDNSGSTNMFPEIGLSFAPMGAQPNDLLISFSCNNVDAKTFAWPYPNRGLKADTQKKLAVVIKKIFPY